MTERRKPAPFISRSVSMQLEPFVDAIAVAAHTGKKPRTIMKWARQGRIPAHPFSGTARRTWVFKLSEIDSYILALRPGCSAEKK
jgi:hypothetical protein